MLGLTCRFLSPKMNYGFSLRITNMCCFVVYISQKETEALVKKHRGESLISHPSCTENRQVRVLNASSSLWYPSPITPRPTKPFLSTLARAVRFRYGGRCNFEGRSVCTLNLISPTLSLCLPRQSLLIGVHLKSGLWVWREGYGGRGDQRSCRVAWERSFLEHDSWLQSVIMVFN